MDNHLNNRTRSGVPGGEIYPLLILAAAIISRLPSMGAYWNQDDWSLLAAADGLIPGDWLQARLLSQVAYWRLLYPLFGLSTQPWAWTRLLLHAASALLVYRIGRRGGLSPHGAGVAGLLFAVTPLSFTPLYWASGIQELLGATLGLAAVDLFLRRGRLGLVLAGSAAIGSLLAKESALLLPLLFAGLAVFGKREHRPQQLLLSAFLLAVAIGEGVLVLGRFPHGDGSVYDIGSPATVLLNLVQYAWWMATPGPVFSSASSFWTGVTGLVIWTGWGWLAWRTWRSGLSGSATSRLPAAALAASLLSLLPATVLQYHLQPYLAYPAFAGLALVLGFLADRSRLGTSLSLSPLMPLILTALLIGVGWSGMEYRLSRRDARGAPADPLVLATSLSYEALNTLRTLPAAAGARIAILQVPEKGSRLSAQIPYPTPLFLALGGQYGPALAGHPEMSLAWTHNLFSQHFSTIILADASAAAQGSPLPRHWGLAYRAYIYLALNHIGEGRFAEARNVLIFGMSNADKQISFAFDPEQLLVPVDRVRANAQQFLDLIPATDLSVEEREALLETSRELLRTCGILPSITGG